MNNYKQPGDILTLTAPGGGVVSGTAYKIGQLVVVAVADAAAGALFPARCTGVIEMVKDAGTAWTEGELVYWDNGAANVVDESGSTAGKLLIGCAAEAAASAAVLGLVRLNGVAQRDGVSADELEDNAVDTAAIQDDAVTAAKIDLFVSGEETGTGSPQNVAHGLGGTPTVVLAILTEFADTLAVDIAYGTHDATNCVLTVASGAKFKILAIL